MRLTHYPSGKIQIQPRGGRSNVKFQTTLLNKLDQAGASVLPLTIDSNTRLEFYEVASKLHDESLVHNRETLNGFPLMSVPDIELAGMLNSFSKPFSLRHGSPIAHKLVTRALSFGIDEIEGGPLTYLLPYSRKVPITEAINSWKLVENNCAEALSRNGRPILRESFGVLTAVLVPPYMALLASILELFFAQENGVKHFMIGLQSCGNIDQDIVQFAAAKKIIILLKIYLPSEIEIYYAYHHWMGPFPREESEANNIIDACNLAASIAGVDKVVVKTAVEAYGVPTEDINADAVKRTANSIRKTDISKYAYIVKEYEEEIDFLAHEVVSCILSIFHEFKIEDGLKYAVEEGILDLMFSPHLSVKRNIEVCRDKNGWIRFNSFGKTKVSNEYKRFEQRNLELPDGFLSNKQIAKDMLWPHPQNDINILITELQNEVRNQIEN